MLAASLIKERKTQPNERKVLLVAAPPVGVGANINSLHFVLKDHRSIYRDKCPTYVCMHDLWINPFVL